MVVVGRGSSKPRVLARGFATPLGLAWVGSTLFVSAQGYVSRLDVRGRQVVSRRKIVTRLPFDRHQQDTIALGPDGRLYLGSGSTCDVCTGEGRPQRRDPLLPPGRRRPARSSPAACAIRSGSSSSVRPSTSRTTPATISATTSRPRRSSGSGRGPTTAGRAAGRAGGCGGCRAPAAASHRRSPTSSRIRRRTRSRLWAGTLIVAEWGQYLSERWGRKLVQVNVRTGRSSTLVDGFVHPLGLAVEPQAGGLLAGDWSRGVVYRLRKR